MRNGINSLAGTRKIGAVASGISGWRRFLMVCMTALSVAVVVSVPLSSAVHAQEDDEEDSFETKFIKKFLGINDRD